MGANLQPTCISVSKTINAGAESLHGSHCLALARDELFNVKQPMLVEDTSAHCRKAVRRTGQGAMVITSTT